MAPEGQQSSNRSRSQARGLEEGAPVPEQRFVGDLGAGDVGRRLMSLIRQRRRNSTQDGQGGIRTLDTLAGMPPFQGGAFNHSATCPEAFSRGNLASLEGEYNVRFSA